VLRIDDESSETNQAGINVSSRFFFLLSLGAFLVFVGIAIVVVAAVLSWGGSAGFGAVIFIGPFPIAIGSGRWSTWLILIGIVLTVLSVAVFLIMRRRFETSGD
jgi:uncharacterized membrane protein